MKLVTFLLNIVATVFLGLALWALVSALRAWGSYDMGPITGLVLFFLQALPAFAVSALCFVGARTISSRQKALSHASLTRAGWSTGRILVWIGFALAIIAVIAEAANTNWERLGDLKMVVVPLVLINAVPGLLLAIFGYWLLRRGPVED